MKGISAKHLNEMSKEFNSERANLIAASAAVKSGIMDASADYRAVGRLPFTFSVDLKQGKITDQKISGRCWIFSALNTFRYEIIKKYKLDTFELSQNYLFFYDKLEKANYFLENVLKTTDEPINGRLYQFLNQDPLADGGQWDMLANLVEKYGVVPKEAYGDAAGAKASRWFDQYLSTRLREDAMILRELSQKGEKPAALQKRKEEMITEFYRMLCISLGEPPKKFDFTLRNKEDQVWQESGITPQEFFKKYVGLKLSDYVSLIHAPTKDKPFNKMYTVKFLGNVAEGQPVRYLNLPMDKIKKAAIKQLKDGHPVWFGSDCTKFGLRKEGVFDRDAAAVERLFGLEFGFTKAQALDYGDSAMNHAMVILGVNLNEKGVSDRWRIENSWGKDSGNDGYYVASDAWFDEYVYQVVVNKKYLDAATRKLLDQKLIELEPWDPFGTLA
ncbi:MAG: C1 family peptidase [Lachnospiraceae bacterium]|nr:C1 family peptidase [Lachnospiraceae bacterium]